MKRVSNFKADNYGNSCDMSTISVSVRVIFTECEKNRWQECGMTLLWDIWLYMETQKGVLGIVTVKIQKHSK